MQRTSGLRKVGLPTARDLAAEQAAYDAIPWATRAGAQLESGVETLKQSAVGTLAKAGGTALSIMDRIDRGEAVTDADDPAGYQHMGQADRQSLRAQSTAGLARNVGRLAESDAAQKALPRSPAADALVQRANDGDWSGAWQAFATDPAGILQQFSLESAPLAAPGLIAGTIAAPVGGVPAFLAGLAGGSYPTEYGLAVVDLLRDRGINLQDQRAVETALTDPAFLAEAGRKGNMRGTAIAAFDAAGGRLAAPLRGGSALRNVGIGARNVAAETASEMAGEASAQFSADGEFKPGDIIAEGLGALPQSAGITAARTVMHADPASQAAAAPAAERQEPYFGTEPPNLPSVDLPPTPAGYPFQESTVPAGAQPAEPFVGADPRAPVSRETPPVPPQPSVRDIMDDDRPLDEIRADQEAATAAAIPQEEATRSNPTVILTAEDVDRAAQRTNASPPPAQAEAGNYAKAVVDWNGLKINIETPRGGERTAKDGSWSVPDFPAHYGEIRRTEGADGDPVDVYIGQDVAAPTIYVIDQKEPTGAFDEHKVMIGFSSPDDALATYERAFSDGSAQSRIGAVTPMTQRQFKNWLKNGDNTKPVTYKPGAGLAPKKRASLGRPMDAVEFIAASGGLRDPGGELRAMDAHRTIVPRLGNLIRKAGQEPDMMREAMVEAGYLSEGSTSSDLFELLRKGIAARKAKDFRARGWSQNDSGWVAEQDATEQAADAERRFNETRDEVESSVKAAGGNLLPEEIDRVMALIGAGEDIAEAIYIVVTAAAIDADAVAAKVEAQVNDGTDTPFPDSELPGPDAKRGESEDAEPRRAGSPAGEPAGPAAQPEPAAEAAGRDPAPDREPERSREDQGEEGEAGEVGEAAAEAPDTSEADARLAEQDHLKIWNSGPFKAWLRGLGADRMPHRESPVAGAMVRGWRDAKEGKPPAARLLNTSDMKPTGFNPISDYLMGYWGGKFGESKEIRALAIGSTMGSEEAMAILNGEEAPDETPPPRFSQAEAKDFAEQLVREGRTTAGNTFDADGNTVYFSVDQGRFVDYTSSARPAPFKEIKEGQIGVWTNRGGHVFKVADLRKPVSEQTAQGEQTVIPGAEKANDRTVAERRMEGGKKAAKPQQAADEGLFDTGARKQTVMFDRQRRPKRILLNSADGVVADEIPILNDAKGYVRLAPEYVAKRDALAQMVAPIITRITGLRDMNVVIVDRLLGKVEADKDTGRPETWDDVAGVVSPVDKLLVMALDNPDPVSTARHESVHLLRDFGVITPAEWNILARAAQDEGWLARHDIKRFYPDLTKDKQIEEAVAVEFGKGDYQSDQSSEVNKIFRKVAEFLRRIRAAYRRVFGKDPDWRDIFSAMETGKLASAEAVPSGQQAAMADRRPMFNRVAGIPAAAEPHLSAFRNMERLKNHPDYKAAKGGDGEAAIRLVRDVVPAEMIEAAQQRFEEGTLFAPVLAEEFTGDNQIPAALAGMFAAATGGDTSTEVVQVNRAFHTGAGPMERLLARSLFEGAVKQGGSYVIVDDVTTMGGTLADMASHIQAGGGKVVGTITLVNASREGVLVPKRHVLTQIERRFGDAVKDLFDIEPASLTADEARYILNFRDAEGLRGRAASAEGERNRRLSTKGIQSPEAEAESDQGGISPAGADDAPLLDPDKKKTKPMFNRLVEKEPTQLARKEGMLWGLAHGYPVDRALKMPFDWFGGMDDKGNWKPGVKLTEKAGKLITEAKFSKGGAFNWLNPTLEAARAGLIDRYGLQADYIARDRERRLDERHVALEGRDLLAKLAETVKTPEEWRVLHAVLTGEEIPADQWQELAEPVRVAIDQLSQEAVALGLLSPESYERNRGTYLHRVYTKYEDSKSSLARWAGQQMTSRRRRVLGDQLKGRGIFLDVDMPRLMEDVPGYAGGMGKPADIKQSFRLLERQAQQDLPLGEKRKPVVEDRVWWPADKDVPGKYADYQDRGTWEVRDIRNGKAVLWRDYTKAEREQMGEITDARYTIAKTFLTMAHDLAVGRFYRDIARNEGWARAQEPADRWVNASDYNRFWNDADVEWVKVPDTVIPNSGGKLRWGALSGKFVRAEIWRDLNEIEALTKRGIWSELLAQWKQNKTARNPVVHMNNVMSNFMLMDMADVRMTDFASAARSYLNKDGLWKLANDNAAFGADMVSSEMRRDILQPVLDEISKQNAIEVSKADGAMGKAFAVLGKLARLLEPVKKLDQKMLQAYQLEDEVFRLALFKRRLDQGFSPKSAADEAREQFIDYDIRAPWINFLRRSFLPFISYTYRAAPIIAKTIAGKPWKLAKYFAIAYGINALAYAMLGDDGDEDKERGSLRENERGRTWIGVPRLMRLPGNRDDNPVFLDIRRWIPGADVFDLGQGSSALPIPAPLVPGGPIAMGAEIFLNKKSFDGKAIINTKTDTPWEQAKNIGDYAWKSLAPSAPWVPGSWYWEKIALAAKGARDRAGNDYSLPEALLQSAGIKVGTRDVDFGYAMQFKELDSIGRELNFQAGTLRKDFGQGKLSETAFRDAMQSITEKRQRLADRRGEITKTRAGQ
ncbi:hypothetical protein [Ferrovibrio terrae]|uniref:hypothetical protein n=1 Tax=Ferrovibrio terrae TaxID=2594003 RepID=UPI003137DF37